MKNQVILVMRGFIICVMLHVIISTANAQVVRIPGSIRPGQIEKQLKELPTPKAQPSPIKVIPEQPIPVPEEGAVSFELKGVKFSVSTVYPEADLNVFFSNLIGKTVTLKQVQAAASNATAKYRNDGYVLAQILIPKQTLKKGVVQLDVLEGSIDEIKYQGDTTKDRIGLLENYIAKIRETKPVRIDKIERYLLLINDLPGITAHGSLAPSHKQPGAADLVIEITSQSFSGTLGFR